MSQPSNKSPVTEPMLRKLLMSVAASRRKSGASLGEGGAVTICRWAEEVLVSYNVLLMVLDGSMLADVDAEGKATFVAADTFLSEEELVTEGLEGGRVVLAAIQIASRARYRS